VLQISILLEPQRRPVVKLIPFLLAVFPLLGSQTVTAYIVTRATTTESRALFLARLVKMNATKLHLYDNTSLIRVEIAPTALAGLQSDPDVELVVPDHETQETYGPMPEPKPISCAVPVAPPAVPLPPAPLLPPAPPLPSMPMMPMASGGVGAYGLADALAGGVVQKLLNRPASCKVSLVSKHAIYPAPGGEGLIEVNASGSCSWHAQASVGWITILSGSGVSGSGVISYRVMPGEGLQRSASIWIEATPGGSPVKGKASQVVTQNR
jgi:hypothetical protein